MPGKVTVGPQQADAVRKGAGSVTKESDLGSKGWGFQSVGVQAAGRLKAGGDNVIPLKKRGASDNLVNLVLGLRSTASSRALIGIVHLAPGVVGVSAALRRVVSVVCHRLETVRRLHAFFLN